MDIEIRKCREEDVELLGEHIPHTERHRRLFNYQTRSGSPYLIGWIGERPVGHLLLQFEGPGIPLVRERIGGNIPEISGLLVHPPEMRSVGIGRQLIAEAERISKEEGYARVGLTLVTENTKAGELYKRLGYVDSGIGEFDNTWYEVQEDGTDLEVVDHCVYLVKDL